MAQNDIREVLKDSEKEMCAQEISEKLNINLRSIQKNLTKMLNYQEITIIKEDKYQKRWYKLK